MTENRKSFLPVVSTEGLRLAGAGSVAGMAASLLLARWLERIILTADGLSVWVWLAAPLAMVGAVAIARGCRLGAR